MEHEEFEKRYGNELRKIAAFAARYVVNHYEACRDYKVDLEEYGVQVWYSRAYYERVDPSREEKEILSYILKTIRWRLIDFCKDKMKDLESLWDPVDLNDLTAENVSCDPYETFVKRKRIIILNEAISDLDDEDRDIIVKRFLEGRSNKEIARSYGISEPGANQKLKRAIKRLANNPKINELKELLEHEGRYRKKA